MCSPQSCPTSPLTLAKHRAPPPFRPQKAFYENVVRGFIARGKGNAREPLYTQVAVVPTPAGGLDDSGGASGYGSYGGNDVWSTAKANIENGSPEGFPMNVDKDRPETGGHAGTGGASGGEEQPRRHSPHGVETGGGGTPGTAATGSAGEGGRAGGVEGEGIGPVWVPSTGANGIGADGRYSARTAAAGGAGQETGESIVGLITCQVNGDAQVVCLFALRAPAPPVNGALFFSWCHAVGFFRYQAACHVRGCRVCAVLPPCTGFGARVPASSQAIQVFQGCPFAHEKQQAAAHHAPQSCRA